ncbi:MAG: hypothetical protein M3R04_02460 [bacterium]|nr:hypothetical protein [bacterium]
MTALPFAIRECRESDLPLVLNSWLRSYRNEDAVRTVTNEIYYSEVVGQKARILDLMAHGRTVVACDLDDADSVFGWACSSIAHPGVSVPPVMHYVYVKQAYRGNGLGRALLGALGVGKAPVWATHETRAVRALGGYCYVPQWRPM